MTLDKRGITSISSIVLVKMQGNKVLMLSCEFVMHAVIFDSAS
jgi:hypothetical protein